MSEGLAETERAAIRAKVFTHLSGVVMAPTVSALWERGALELLTSTPGPVVFADVVKHTHANAGYLRVPCVCWHRVAGLSNNRSTTARGCAR